MKPLYFICFIRDSNPKHYVVLDDANDLVTAKRKRNLTGDLVFHNDGRIVEDFSWVNNALDGYAIRCIKDKIRIDFSEHIFRQNDKRKSQIDFKF